jgi:pilus assembly protein CpaE
MQKKQVLHGEKTTAAKNKSSLGQVIAIFGTKGGVGRTFVSANLAVALFKATNKRVVLVDLDLDFGDAALALNIVPQYTISDIVDDIRNIDSDMIESYLIPHESGIKVLAANSKPRITEFINAEHIDIILRTLQNAFDYIIVDMPARFYEPVNPAFNAADNLIMITTPEISTVRNIKSSLMTLNDLNYSKLKIKILLNKADNKLEIKQKDIENTLKSSVYASIDADYKLVPSSLNQGVPIVMKYPKSSVSKGFMSLADKLTKEANKA